jgi:hypothetical protein
VILVTLKADWRSPRDDALWYSAALHLRFDLE